MLSFFSSAHDFQYLETRGNSGSSISKESPTGMFPLLRYIMLRIIRSVRRVAVGVTCCESSARCGVFPDLTQSTMRGVLPTTWQCRYTRAPSSAPSNFQSLGRGRRDSTVFVDHIKYIIHAKTEWIFVCSIRAVISRHFEVEINIRYEVRN